MAGCDETVRVLSIQSHVVHGYVGNRSAVFPLQVCNDTNAHPKVNPGGRQAYDRVHLSIQGTLTTAILSEIILTMQMVDIDL